MCRIALLLLTVVLASNAQVYSPKVLAKNQPDSSDLSRLAADIYQHSAARTPREKAEAIWRFFLTDGRFVEPGFWYHIAGWAYEEPVGEVLDPVKLLNSYGFGLCYHIAPLLAATWKAGGFEDARVWFLTGHTVAEVFYEGAYHYFDSDMMGYNSLPDGAVASVRQIEENGSIITATTGGKSKPWYPADVRANAIGGLAALFTTTKDNWLFPFERAPRGHTMDFVLRPGERLIRYFEPEREGLFYLPYKNVDGQWREFPQEIAQYDIRSEDGPRSQKDTRRWATGRLEYRPQPSGAAVQVHEVRSPYVIIDSEFVMDAALPDASDSVTVETSTDDGRTWTEACRLAGPHAGAWHAAPAVLTRSEQGRRTAVSGRYSYLVRLSTTAPAKVRDVLITTFVQQNPRTLPALHPGHNEFVYTSDPRRIRRELAIDPVHACATAQACRNARFQSDGSQGYWTARESGAAEFVFRVRASDGGGLAAVHAGARFLDLSAGLAPDKFTAEVRSVPPIPARRPEASIAWSNSPAGPYNIVWQYDANPEWMDNQPVPRVLRWPEIDRDIPVGRSPEVFVRYRVRDLAVDQFRLAFDTLGTTDSPLDIVHRWIENGAAKMHTVHIPAGSRQVAYAIDVPVTASVINQSVTFETSERPR